MIEMKTIPPKQQSEGKYFTTSLILPFKTFAPYEFFNNS